MALDIENGDMEKLSAEDLEIELQRIRNSFSVEFRVSAAQVLREKVYQRVEALAQNKDLLIEIAKRSGAEASADKIIELAWMEISLDTIMILVDKIRELNEKMSSIKHLMPAVSTRKH